MKENTSIDHYLDLCGVVCPVNFVKCCIALDNLSYNQVLKVDLDLGESETSVIDGLKDKGYKVRTYYRDSEKVTLIISSE
tara:strand:- start:251 stop:490 length:240 start_codon:yes stop_codon:yes gene_type:complete